MQAGAFNKFFRNRTFLSCFFLAVMVIYFRTLSAPWYFDDFPAIVSKCSLRDLGLTVEKFFAPRGPVDVTFALNFKLHRLQVAGYHVVNITIHLANGLLFYLLSSRIFKGNSLQQYTATMIFLLHPLQTQAVNYIVQRYTLAAAFCGLISLLLIAKWSEFKLSSCQPIAAIVIYLAAILFSVLAVLCKQNMATLAIIIPLFCYYFIDRQWTKNELFGYLFLPFVFMPLLESMHQLVVPLATGTSLGEVTGVHVSTDYPVVSPLHYFATQWNVILIYVRLCALPYGQALDYGYQVVTDVLTIQNIVALLGLSILVSLAVIVRKSLPRVSFGIAWFLIFLLVESTFIPLDPLFEHRLYLPLAGFAIIAADALGRLPGKKTIGIAVAMITILLGMLTWNRNQMWLSSSDLLVDNVKKRPYNARIYAGAANALAETGDVSGGELLLQQGFKRGLRHVAMYISLVNILITEGCLLEAVQIGEEGLRYYPESADIMYSIGMAEDLRKNHARAEEYFRRAIELYPNQEQGYSNYGTSMFNQGRLKEAEAAYRKALEINPNYSFAYLNLGNVLKRLNRPLEAGEALWRSYQLGGDVRALEALTTIKAEIGDHAAVQSLLHELESISPAKAEALRRQLMR